MKNSLIFPTTLVCVIFISIVFLTTADVLFTLYISANSNILSDDHPLYGENNGVFIIDGDDIKFKYQDIIYDEFITIDDEFYSNFDDNKSKFEEIMKPKKNYALFLIDYNQDVDTIKNFGISVMLYNIKTSRANINLIQSDSFNHDTFSISYNYLALVTV